MDLTDKVAIITGSGQGLGREFAKKLLEAGVRVCISDVNSATGIRTAAELGQQYGEERVHFIQCDVTKEDDLHALYDGCETYFKKPVDIFCNNAGIGHTLGWKLCMEIDIMAVMAATNLALARMDVRKGGNGGIIVNTASIAGLVPAISEDLTPYFVAKSAVVSLTRSLGQDRVLSASGVKVQAICPGFTDTSILDDLVRGGKKVISKSFGPVMSPDYVADGFLKTIKYGENGAVVVVVPDAPPFDVAGQPRAVLYVLGYMSKFCNLLMGTPLPTTRHQVLGLALSFLILTLMIFMLNHSHVTLTSFDQLT